MFDPAAGINELEHVRGLSEQICVIFLSISGFLPIRVSNRGSEFIFDPTVTYSSNAFTSFSSIQAAFPRSVETEFTHFMISRVAVTLSMGAFLATRKPDFTVW